MTKSRPSTILLIEDNPDIVEVIQYNLTREGFAMRIATNGEDGLREATTKHPALILLDLMLPRMDGLEVCRSLRGRKETNAIPIVMLTAKGEESDVVLGLGVGADDYVVKPFNPKELIARIRAVLRRASRQADSSEQKIIRIGKLVVDSDRHEVRLGNVEVKTTRAEFRLLRALASSPGRVFTRDRLIDEMGGTDVVIVDRNVDVHVSSLRKKLKDYGDSILTVRGVGYRFRD